MNKRVVSVFGASSPLPGSPAYEDACEVGRLLAENGCTVMTGGYGGTMEGVSKGAKSVGGHVIGVTVGLLEGPGRRSGPNAFVDEVIRYERLRDRLLHLVDRCDAFIALPGGIGTLSEVSLAWSFLQLGEIPPRPFVLMGEAWGNLLDQFYGSGEYIRAHHRQLYRVARTPQEAVQMIGDGVTG